MPERKKQTKKSRSAAARKGARTKKLKRLGLVTRWSIGFMDFERYKVEPGDVDGVREIIKAVKNIHRGRRFFYGGQAQIKDDTSGKEYTNNTDQFLDTDTGRIPELFEMLDEITINPSPVTESFTVEGLFVVIRFAKRKST